MFVDEILTQVQQLQKDLDPNNPKAIQERSLDTLLEIWAALRRRFPNQAAHYRKPIDALKHCGRLAEAIALCRVAIDKFDGELWPLAEAGWLAVLNDDHEAAVSYAAQARARFPNHEAGYISGSAALRKLHRFAEADAVADEAAIKFPDEIWVQEMRAWIGSERGDWARAKRNAEALRRTAPDRQAGYMLGWRGCLHMQQHTQAQLILDQAMKRFTAESWPWVDAAWLTASIRDRSGALALWQQARGRPPGTLKDTVLLAIARCLTELELYDAADEACLLLMKYHPVAEAYRQYARIAASRNMPELASQRWDEAQRRFPDDIELRKEADAARLPHAGHSRPGFTPVGTPVKIATIVDEPARHILARFESIGQDCEFGLLQRRFSLEPLGLLRWSNTFIDFLIEMLETNFAGVGDEDRTSLTVASWGELLIRDTKYNADQHSFVNEKDVDRVRFLHDQRLKIKFSVRMMLETLEENEKIFVYKCNYKLPRQRVDALWQALRVHNPHNRLLFVEPSEGSVETAYNLVRPGLMVVQMNGLGPQHGPDGAYWDIPFDAWVEVCKAALVAMPDTVASR